MITLAGLASTPGTADGSGNKARFNFPTGLTVDANNYVYIADTDNHAVRVISSAPVITTQPLTQTAAAGANVSFTVAATGQPTPICQWYKDGAAIPGANATTFSLTNAQTSNSGTYTVTVSNVMGVVTSTSATLTVSSNNSSGSSSSGGGGGGAPTHWFFAVLILLNLSRRMFRK